VSKRKRIKTPERTKARADRDREIERQRAGQLVATIYDKWKTNLMGTPLKPSDLMGQINVLANEIQTKIKDKAMVGACMWILDKKIADLHLAEKVGLFLVRIHAVCPNMVTVNNIDMICNWAGDAFVQRNEFDDGKAWFDCPQCGKKIEQGSMKEVGFTDEDPDKIVPMPPTP
jgi:hypothetical protein